MKHLTSLTQLSLDTALKRDTFSEALLSMIYSYQHLEKLSLLLKIEGSNFSVNIPPKELPNLKSLRITFTEDVFTRKEQCISKMLIPLEAFELCTNIEVLKIHNQTSKNVVIDWNSLRPFTKLKKLELTCDKMIGWDVANQVLPRLESLTLYVSQGIDGSLESLPDTIQYLDIDATIELESNKFLRRLPAMTALSTLKFSMEGVSTSLIFPCSLVQLQISHLSLRKGEQTFSNFLFSLHQLETLKILDSVIEDLYGLLKSILILKHSIRKVYIEKSESANIDSVRNSKSQAKLNIGHPVLKEYDQARIFLTLSGFAWKQHSLLNQYSCIEFM
ncbi:hypothetical protein C9374_002948 [Naegleria lovaniensis]|uniref:Uncharacterized protein n=1 Tax=Naegleria lovaniensis TaxID=51637 RepID=A0AA88GTF1_NAELO|nr:uncharacterized protein C9374_002948 [Naegleria lovaniensis]KAG2385799.1 hypothetical protein C9374_002948 [Naegleria lovaniensis]